MLKFLDVEIPPNIDAGRFSKGNVRREQDNFSSDRT